MRHSPRKLALLLLATSLPTIAAAQASVPARAAANAPAADASAAQDDDLHTPDADLVVTAPLDSARHSIGSVAVVEGDALARSLRAQIGDALTSLPGVSASSFTPGASRPLLRGFGGDRAPILTDGIASIDASGTSADHAVAVDTLGAERVEIIRGAASLLYGANPVAGAVNVIDRRIPLRVPESHVHLDALFSGGTAADSRSAAMALDAALTPQLVAHVDGSWSKGQDVHIGGFVAAPGLRHDLFAAAADAYGGGDDALGDKLTNAANLRGRLPNSASESYALTGSLAWIDDGGNLGLSFSRLHSDYGIPPRPGDDEAAQIRLNQWRADMRAEVNVGGPFVDRLTLRAGFADYAHGEFDDGVLGTRFLTKGVEGRFTILQAARGDWRGTSGLSLSLRDLNVIGDEAFLPASTSQTIAFFTQQRFATDWGRFAASARLAQSRIATDSGAISRRFTLFSAALGWEMDLGDAGSTLGLTLSRTRRAPNAEELLSNGPHAATQSYELGNPDFRPEDSWGVEGDLHLHVNDVHAKFSAFGAWFNNFIAPFDSGARIDDLPVFQYRQQNAHYLGGEAQIEGPIANLGTTRLSGDIAADYVRARLNNGGNIPQIPPLRLRGGLSWGNDGWNIRGEGEWTAAQHRLAANETPNDGQFLVNLSAQWKPLAGNRALTLILSADNIFDVDARRHTSLTKDYVPLSGRDIRLTARLSI